MNNVLHSGGASLPFLTRTATGYPYPPPTLPCPYAFQMHAPVTNIYSVEFADILTNTSVSLSTKRYEFDTRWHMAGWDADTMHVHSMPCILTQGSVS